MRRVRWVALLLGGVAGFIATKAHADDPAPTTYSLSWVRAEGAEDCPTGRALAAEVERRLGRKVFDIAAERSFEVEVTRFGARYRSDVYVRDGAGRAVGQRSLQSDEPGCAALFGATALAIALVIDPDAASRPTPVQAVAAFEPPPVATPPTPPTAPPPPAEPVVVAAPSTPEPAKPVVPAPARVTMSLRGMLTMGAVPEVSPGAGVAFTVRPGPRYGFALAAAYSSARTASEGSAIFEIGLTRFTAALTADLVSSDDLRLLLSAGPSLGALHVAVVAPSPVTEAGDFLFSAVELAAGLQISVTNLVFMDLGAQALVPLKRQEFFTRGQSDPVWSQPWFSGSAFLGVGARFP